MKNAIEYELERDSAVTIGKFDGIHLGHRELIRRIVNKKDEGLLAVVFTFAQSPDAVLRHAQEEQLMTSAERASLLEELGVDVLIECPFVPEIYTMEPETFVREVLLRRTRMRFLAVGEDFRFGRGAGGNVSLLKELSEEEVFSLEVIPDVVWEGEKVSSTGIRRHLRDGDADGAKHMLGAS